MITRIVVLFGILAGLLAVLPDTAQAQCERNQDAAVQCFARNAIATGLVDVPRGMSSSEYREYAVSVSRVIQAPTATVFLLGISGAVADAMPPSNADGSSNRSAQYAAVNAILEAALKDGMVTLPRGARSDHWKLMGRQITGAMGENSGVTISPGAVLKILDSYVVAATSSGGSVDWPKATAGISSMVDGLVNGGLLKLPAGITVGNVKQFASDVSYAIHQYKQSTRKARLQVAEAAASEATEAAALEVPEPTAVDEEPILNESRTGGRRGRGWGDRR